MASKDAVAVIATKLYVKGVSDGIVRANAFIEISGNSPLYCQPEKLALGIESYIGIIDRQIKALSSSGLPPEQLEQTDIGLVLLAGLQATFPCKRGNEKPL